MTLQLELDPKTEASLKSLAERRGVTPEQFADEFLRDMLPFYSSDTGRLVPGDIDKMTRILTADSKDLPILPPEVNDRESYYEDRR